MPRALFIAPSAYPLGGVQTWLDYLVAGLPDHGWQAIVGLAAGRCHDVAAYRAAHPALPCIAIENATGSREGRVRAILAALEALRPDVVIGVNIPDTYEAAARARSRGLNVRTVMSVHGIQPDLFDDLAIEAGHLDGVVCTNRLALALAGQHGIEAARLHYAAYGIPVPPWRGTRTGGPLRLAYVGRFEQQQKRVFDLPRILDLLSDSGVDFEMSIAGGGPDESSLHALLREHIAAGRVRWLGSLSADSLAEQVYSQADALLVTSAWETGPIVAWEAMAHGAALVSSRYVGSGLEGALRHEGNCLLFLPGDDAGAAHQLRRIAGPELRERIASQGYAMVRDRYSQGTSLRSWAAALDAILAAPPPAASGPRGAIEAAGRLDRWIGTGRAETVRRLVGLRFDHLSPGGEWPHSYGRRAADDATFWNQASLADGVLS